MTKIEIVMVLTTLMSITWAAIVTIHTILHVMYLKTNGTQMEGRCLDESI